MNEIIGTNSISSASTSISSASISSAQDRQNNLEQARREATANQVADGQAAQQRRSEQLRETNEIVQRAIGANTRLEITAGQETSRFIYRAVDIDTGEVVSEWPPEQFSNLLNILASQQDGAEANISGLVLNEQA